MSLQFISRHLRELNCCHQRKKKSTKPQKNEQESPIDPPVYISNKKSEQESLKDPPVDISNKKSDPIDEHVPEPNTSNIINNPIEIQVSISNNSSLTKTVYPVVSEKNIPKPNSSDWEEICTVPTISDKSDVKVNI